MTQTIGVLAGLPFLIPVFRAFQDEWSQFMSDAESGREPEAFGPTFLGGVGWELLAFALVMLLVSMVYEIGFLRWMQATPGKLALGIQVRLRELGNVPMVGGLLSTAWLINFLWPLWDDKFQALHDKAARTNVVRSR